MRGLRNSSSFTTINPLHAGYEGGDFEKGLSPAPQDETEVFHTGNQRKKLMVGGLVFLLCVGVTVFLVLDQGVFGPPKERSQNKDTDDTNQASTFLPTVTPTAGPNTPAPTSPTTPAPTAPTVVPTFAPTDVPTSTPSSAPTDAPTKVPSKHPTSPPTSPPTRSPSRAPNTIPTLPPTSFPSIQPSSQPSKAPSVQPTFLPSASPTKGPTTAPTGLPTLSPSSSPIKSPTHLPTNSPTSSPISCFRIYADVRDDNSDSITDITSPDGVILKNNDVSNQAKDNSPYPMTEYSGNIVKDVTIEFDDNSSGGHSGSLKVTAPQGYRVTSLFSFVVRRDADWILKNLQVVSAEDKPSYWRSKQVSLASAGSTITAPFQAYDFTVLGDHLIQCLWPRCSGSGADYNYFMFADVCRN